MQKLRDVCWGFSTPFFPPAALMPGDVGNRPGALHDGGLRKSGKWQEASTESRSCCRQVQQRSVLPSKKNMGCLFCVFLLLLYMFFIYHFAFYNSYVFFLGCQRLS